MRSDQKSLLTVNSGERSIAPSGLLEISAEPLLGTWRPFRLVIQEAASWLVLDVRVDVLAAPSSFGRGLPGVHVRLDGRDVVACGEHLLKRPEQGAHFGVVLPMGRCPEIAWPVLRPGLALALLLKNVGAVSREFWAQVLMHERAP